MIMMSTKIKFYDTSSLLLDAESIFEKKENFFISSITLSELESIKTSAYKDEEIKEQARELSRKLKQHFGNYKIIIFKEKYLKPITKASLLINNDTKILSCAIYISKKYDIEFITNDINLFTISKMFLKKVNMINPVKDNYTGFKDLILSNDNLIEFYNNYDKNIYDLKNNEYLIIRDTNNEIVDRLVWTNGKYEPLRFDVLNSKTFGKIKAKDVYQQLAFDSFNRNQMTYIGGPAGSGKTLCALGYLFQKLEKEEISQIIIFCNPIVAKNAAKLGFYPGEMLEKLLSTQIGHILTSKLGDRMAVETLIKNEQLVLIPAGDARGYQTKPHSGIYIIEAQNYDITLLRMLLQRIDNTSIVILDGDRKEQTDLNVYSGYNNGLEEMSKVFRGSSVYGQVELQNIYRSEIANIAQRMK